MLERWAGGTCESSEVTCVLPAFVFCFVFFKPRGGSVCVQSVCLVEIRFIACVRVCVWESERERVYPSPKTPLRWAEVMDDGWRL